MKTDKEQYTAPTVEVIEMEAQNVMALSDPGFGTTDDPDYTPDKVDFWGN